MAEDRAQGVEAVLLARSADGDHEAFETLFRRFERPLYAYFVRMMRDESLAEDLVCDTMTAVWKGARGFRGASAPSTWIFGIAHKLAVAALRRRRPEVALEEAAEATSGAGPDETAERADVAARVRKAVAALSPDHRAVVELTFTHGFSYPEISKILGIPVGTTKTRMFHARRKLKEALEKVGIGDAN